MKYSRQRELIQRTVEQNQVHPTADTVYSLVRESEPNISLGTVYRNLNLLYEQGVLRKICIPNASDRFDGRLDEHQHSICTRCGRMFDVGIEAVYELDEQIKGIADFTVTGYQVLIEGVCHRCSVKH